jgi:acyl dehydratase
MSFEPGTELALGQRRSGYAEWNRYAAVNDEFVPIHMDDEEGRRAGYPAAIIMGRLQWSYVHRVLRDALPDGGRIVSVSLQFRGPTVREAVFDVRARVTGVREDGAERLVELDVWVEDEAGAVTAPGTATIAVPS